MAINAQSGTGKVRLFEDFTGFHSAVTETTGFLNLGQFFAGGEGLEDNDSGCVPSTTAPLSGSATITSGDTDADTAFVGTGLIFDVGLMGPLVFETRLQLPDLDAKEVFAGFTSILSFDEQLADIVINASGTSITIPADCVGFYLSDELTDDEDWHGIHAGGTTGDSTTTTAVDLDDDAVAGEWQVLRLEVDPNGDTRWYIDGVLKQTVAGACSTTSDLAAVVAFAANSAEAAIGDVDYILVEANRDWNA